MRIAAYLVSGENEPVYIVNWIARLALGFAIKEDGLREVESVYRLRKDVGVFTGIDTNTYNTIINSNYNKLELQININGKVFNE